MSSFQGQILDPDFSEEKQNSKNIGSLFIGISFLLVIVSFFTGLLISNSRIDASWKQANFKAVDVNKEFQFSTTGTSACDPTSSDGCVAFRFVSKYDCKQVTGLVGLIDVVDTTLLDMKCFR